MRNIDTQDRHNYNFSNEESSLLKNNDKSSIGRYFGVYSNRQNGCTDSRPHLDEDAQKDIDRLSPFGSKLNSISGTMPWTTAYMDDSFTTNSLSEKLLSTLYHFIDWNLRGIGQVYFCNNPVTGALILIGLILQSYKVALYGVVGVFSGNVAALMFNYDRSLIASGLLGYNPFLVGLAIATFHHGDERHMILGIILTCILSTLLFDAMGRMFKKWEAPVFTFPFNISTMIYLVIVSGYTTANNKRHTVESWMGPGPDILNPLECSIATMRGFGQVFLANNLLSCLLIMIGFIVCSRILFVSALLGGMAGTIFAMLSGSIQSSIIQGLLSYNASLTLAAIFLFYVPSISGTMMGLVAVVLSVLVQYGLSFWISPLGLPVMTLPFCIASLVFVWVQYYVRSMLGTQKRHMVYMPPVPLSSIVTPEEHIRRQHVLHDAFYMIFKVIHSSTDNISSRNQLSPTKKTLAVMKEIRRNICGDSTTTTTTTSSSASTIQDENVDKEAKNVFKDLDTKNSGHITGHLFLNYLLQHFDHAHVNLANKAFNLFSVGVDGSHIMDLKNFVLLSRVSNHLGDLKAILVEFAKIVVATSEEDQVLTMDSLNEALENLTGDQHSNLTQSEYDYLCFSSCDFEDAASISGAGNMNSVQMTNFILASFLTFMDEN